MRHVNRIGAREGSVAAPRESADNFSSADTRILENACRALTRRGYKLFQRAPDQPAQPALRQAFRERIHRRDAVDVDETFLAAFDDFGFGMGHRARLGFAQFAVTRKPRRPWQNTFP